MGLRAFDDARHHRAEKQPLPGLGADNDHTGVKLGGSPEDPLGDVGMTADGAQQLAADGHAGRLKLGHRSIQQLPGRHRALQLDSVLARDDALLQDVQDVRVATAGAGQRDRHGADLLCGGARPRRRRADRLRGGRGGDAGGRRRAIGGRWHVGDRRGVDEEHNDERR